MKIKYILAAALVAMFAIPGTASQLAARSEASAMTFGPMATSASAFNDPHAAAQLSIVLPTRFVALDIGAHPLQHFND